MLHSFISVALVIIADFMQVALIDSKRTNCFRPQCMSCSKEFQLNRLSCSSCSALLISSRSCAEQGPIVFPILLAHMVLSAEARLHLRRAVNMQSHGLRRKILRVRQGTILRSVFCPHLHTWTVNRGRKWLLDRLHHVSCIT